MWINKGKIEFFVCVYSKKYLMRVVAKIIERKFLDLIKKYGKDRPLLLQIKSPFIKKSDNEVIV